MVLLIETLQLKIYQHLFTIILAIHMGIVHDRYPHQFLHVFKVSSHEGKTVQAHAGC